MRIQKAMIGAAMLFGCCVAAQAATISLSNIVGTWSDTQTLGNASILIAGSGTASPTVRWGTPVEGSQSGYIFGAAPSAMVIVPPSPSPDFVLGSFAHLNFPIADGVITGVKLRVSADVAVDAINFGQRNFDFQFFHSETPNGDLICPDGGANGVGVNINGCADRVAVGFLNSSESFVVGSDVYTLNIIGFKVGGNLLSEFWTAERLQNNADLIANVTLRSNLVPEPGALALVGLGLLGAAAVRRRRR